ncbi:MAG: hypothetical protein K8W52_28330 [Deltaproteobacteria bacterium]|nr:hypothetical protein [Deltaproteobacteria bacterium]
MGAAWLVGLIGCASSAPRIENAPVAPARTGPDTIVPVPEEPWYRDRTEGRRDECEASLATVPPAHFPSPFEACDPHAESYASPPGGNELHFHYRFFSAALTTARRAQAPGVCCYMIWEFPHYE